MAEPEKPRQENGTSKEPRLYTLSEVSRKSGISMPTLQRYKKLYQNRIPAVGKGRKQRYPEQAFEVFEQIKQENVGRRGRPRKDASAAPARGARGGRKATAAKTAAKKAPAAKKATARKSPAGGRGRAGRPAGTAGAGRGRGGRPKASGGLLTLTEISERTGISYPTLVRYVRLYSDRLPHEGRGRARRFHPEAVEVFRQLRQESGRGGRKPGSGAGARGRVGRPRKDESGVAQRMSAIEKSQQALEKRLRALVKGLQRLIK